jgi:hypothetical protein
MKAKNLFTLQTLIFCLLLNGALVVAYYFMAATFFQGLYQRIGMLMMEAAQRIPEGEGAAELQGYVQDMEGLLLPGLLVPAAIATLLLWLLIQFQGRRVIQRVQPPQTAPSPKAIEEEKRRKREPAPPPSTDPAVQLLSILQRRGRFIDFLEEDLKVYDDAQIGAAVRNIHEGCKQALSEHVKLMPIFSEEEGAPVTVAPGFDAHSVRLTGNVTGDPPFRGTLRHRGWKVVGIDLPRQVEGQEKKGVLAPAEVEITG